MGEEGSARTPVAAHITLGGVPAVVCAACRTKRGVETRSWGERVCVREKKTEAESRVGGAGARLIARPRRACARDGGASERGEREPPQRKNQAPGREGRRRLALVVVGFGVGREACGGKGKKGGQGTGIGGKVRKSETKNQSFLAACRGAGCQLYLDMCRALSSLLRLSCVDTASGPTAAAARTRGSPAPPAQRRRQSAHKERGACPPAPAGARRAPPPHPRRRP